LDVKAHLFVHELNVSGEAARFDENGVLRVPDAPVKQFRMIKGADEWVS